MKRNLKKAGKWLLAGILCGALTVVCFQVERRSGGRYALTAGSGLIAILCFAAAVCSLMGKMNDGNGMMTVEEIFKMNSGGYVAAGHVRGVFLLYRKLRFHRAKTLRRSALRRKGSLPLMRPAAGGGSCMTGSFFTAARKSCSKDRMGRRQRPGSAA